MKRIKSGIGKKFLILNSVLVTFSSLFLGLVFFNEFKELFVENEIKSLKQDVRFYIAKFHGQIGALEENVLLLSKTPPVQGIIRAKQNGGIDPKDGSSEDEWRSRLIEIFSDFLISKPRYISLRFIGISGEGMEIVRVDKARNFINVTHDRNLQSKGHRPYFNETLALEKGQVYLSEFSLNQEHGKVDLPHTPVIRAATPIYDADARPFGIVIANMDATRLIHEGLPWEFPLYVTNHKGYFLSHPNPAKTFSFDLGEEWKIQDELPETTIFFDPKNPIQKDTLLYDGTLNPRVTYFAKMKYDPISPRHFLGVAISENIETLLAGSVHTLFQMGFLLILVVLGSLILTGIFSRRLTRPLHRLIQASDDLARGKEHIDFPTKSQDELGFLAESLESMNQIVKERASALEESEKQNRAIMENVVDGLITIDEIGIVKTFNLSAEKLFGYHRKEVIGRNVTLLMTATDSIRHHEYIERYIKSGRAKIIGIGREVTGLRKDGTEFPMELSVSEVMLQDKEGDVNRVFIGSCRNIEDRKQSENKLAELNEQNDLILNAAGEGIYGLDQEGNTTFINPAGARLIGFEVSEIVGKGMHGLIHHHKPDGSLYPEEDCSIYRAFKDGVSTHSLEEIFWRPNGTSFPVELNSNPVYKNGELVGAVVTFKDITQRKESEFKLLNAKNEAEKANRAKSEFLSRMSHELRTPLNAIMGFSQLELMKDKGDEADNSRNANIRQILESGKHLLDLVNDVLDLSRIESGTLVCSMEPVNLAGLLEEIYSQCKPLGEKRNVSLEYNPADSPESMHIIADRIRLKQVLLNLISNGIKYNRDNGTTTLSLEKLPDDKVRIYVKDQGKGIPPHLREQLFEPFDRLGAENTGIEGTGVGLAISKQLTEDMNGTLGFSSEMSQGSEFYVEFPIAESPGQEPSHEKVEMDPGRMEIETAGQKPKKVLYIEDNSPNMVLISRFLSRFEDMEILSAREPVRGLEIARERIPDLILLDIHLPGMDGFEVFEVLKQDARLKHIPVVALSANALQADIDRALNLGFRSYLVKPIDIDRLAEEINTIWA